MSGLPIVSHLRSTDLIQPLKEQLDSVHFKGSFQLRKFKSNPDLVALKAVELNRFDRIPSPPSCGLDAMLLHRKMEKINPTGSKRAPDKTRLYVRPTSLEYKKCNVLEKIIQNPESETKEIGQLCQEFSKQLSCLK